MRLVGRLTVAVVPVLGVVLVTQCGYERKVVGSRLVGSFLAKSQEATTIEITEQQSPELAGTRLVIEPGALDGDATITLELGLNPLLPSEQVSGPVAIWGPADLRLSTTIELTLPYRLPEGRRIEGLFLFENHENGNERTIPNSELTVEAQHQKVRALIEHLGAFQAGVDSPCDAGCRDGGPSRDGGGGSRDGGGSDGGAFDGGQRDGGSSDGGQRDGGSFDGGQRDGGSSDGGQRDGGSFDGGQRDGGSPDGGHRGDGG